MLKFLKLQYYYRGFQDHVHQVWYNSDEWFERYSSSKIDIFFVIKMFACELLKIWTWKNPRVLIFEMSMFETSSTPIFMNFWEFMDFYVTAVKNFMSYLRHKAAELMKTKLILWSGIKNNLYPPFYLLPTICW